MYIETSATLIKIVNKYFSVDTELDILDVGCGWGKVSFELYLNTKHQYRRIKGIDREFSEHGFYPINNSYLSQYKLQHENDKFYREPTEGLFVYENIDELLYLQSEQRKYDLVVFSNFLHFFSNDVLILFIESALNILKAKGIVFIKMFNNTRNNDDGYCTTLLDNEVIDNVSIIASVIEICHETEHTWLIVKRKF